MTVIGTIAPERAQRPKRKPKAEPTPELSEAGENPAYHKPDEDQIASELTPKWRSRFAFFHSTWKEYDAGVWAARNGNEIRQHIRRELRAYRCRGVGVSQSKIKALESMLEDDLSVMDRQIMAQYEEQQRYVNLRNGLFNLDTMKLEPHRASLYMTTQLDFDYDPDANCPTFNRYLRSSLVYPETRQTDESLYRLTLEALGYSMTARTDLKASFWLVGQRDSGKSTFIALIKAIMGSLHTTIDLTQLGTNRFLLAGIVGKRVVTFTEADSNTMLPDALYKTLVGGSDEVYADVKNREPITFRPECKVWWAMNDMPRIKDRSGATMRRIYIIPFNRTIPAKEQIDKLEKRLMAERAGIFNEMIVYYLRLKSLSDFEPCEQSGVRRQQYINENDTEATFVDERCDRHESYRTQSSVLYTEYKTWCDERGFKPKNYNQIAGEWRRLGFKDHKSNGNTVWEGVRMKSSAVNPNI
jgi:P4 family phage/plasmid primase-like protien